MFSRLIALRRQLQHTTGISDRRHLRYCVLTACGIAGAFIAWLGMQFQGVPSPVNSQDHARLLQAQMFSEGRLANPPLPQSIFFETPWVIQHPSYSAAMPPGGSFPLAVGFLLGDPAYGLWLSIGLATWAVAWMAVGLVSLRWGILSAIWFAGWYGFLCHWGQSYGGESWTVFSMAILLGSIFRWERRKHPRHLAIAGLGGGMGILSNPAAGVVVLVACLVYMNGSSGRKLRRIIIIPAVAALFCAGFMAPYNKATSGSMFKGPTSEYRAQYDRNPRYLWQKPVIAPDFRIPRMEKYDFLVSEAASKWPKNVGRLWYERVNQSVDFFIGIPVLMALFLFFNPVCRSRVWRLIGYLAVAALFIILTKIRWNVNDVSFLACAASLLFAHGLRVMALKRALSLKARIWGCLALGMMVPPLAYARGLDRQEITQALITHTAYQQGVEKHLLTEQPDGKHLVMVKYDDDVAPEIEYVHNSPTPSTQTIIWTRFIEPHNQAEGDKVSAGIQELINAFPGRRLWILSVGTSEEPALREFKWEPGKIGPDSAHSKQ